MAMNNPKYDGDWELISGRGLCGDTCRLRIPGGWLYRERECADKDARTTAIALTFVPRPSKHDPRYPEEG